MIFNTVIVGGGLAGLICGIKLVKEGKKVAILSTGQSALQFSSGSFDLLNALPNGERVDSPIDGVRELIALNDRHPYSKMGVDKFKHYALQGEEFFRGIGVDYRGSCASNHYRITPMGEFRSTWLTSCNMLRSDKFKRLEYKKITICNVAGFLDFYPHLIAKEFRDIGIACEISIIGMEALEQLRKNPTEMRSINIARVFDRRENLDRLVQILKKASPDSEAIILPAMMGLDDATAIEYVRGKIDKPIYTISTLTPSVVGVRLQKYLQKYFVKCGGIYMLGDSVLKIDKMDKGGFNVYSYNHGDMPLESQTVVIATGSFFSQGLKSTPDRIYEPIMDLDVSYDKNRDKWFDTDVFRAQNYISYGIKTDERFRAFKAGEVIDGLYVIGAGLEGFNPIKEGSGAGVSILSSLFVADEVLKF